MLALASRSFRHKTKDMVLLIDSTTLPLSGRGSEWAEFSTELCGAKAHIVYDPDFAAPVYHAITPANVNDITAAKAMPIVPGATYVFDLGYYDYAWWAVLAAAACRIVTRFKTNTPLHDARALPLPHGSEVLSDRIGFLPARQAKSRKNPMSEAVREIVVTTDTGKRLRLLTNDLEAPAQEIADLYKRRWQIELFFRFVKQNLKIKHFYGRSENAVRIQIAVALIAFLIMHLLRTMTKVEHGPKKLVLLVRTNLMHRKDVTRMHQIQHPPPIDSRQLTLDLAYT
jgi:IS4 transposase